MQIIAYLDFQQTLQFSSQKGNMITYIKNLLSENLHLALVWSFMCIILSLWAQTQYLLTEIYLVEK